MVMEHGLPLSPSRAVGLAHAGRRKIAQRGSTIRMEATTVRWPSSSLHPHTLTEPSSATVAPNYSGIRNTCRAWPGTELEDQGAAAHEARGEGGEAASEANLGGEGELSCRSKRKVPGQTPRGGKPDGRLAQRFLDRAPGEHGQAVVAAVGC